VDTVASVRETTLRGNHRTEATEVTEDGIRVEHRGFGARTRKWEIVAQIRRRRKPSTPNPNFLLCDLRDLCAMLSSSSCQPWE